MDVSYEEVFEDIDEDDLQSLSYPGVESTHDLFELMQDAYKGFRCDDLVVLMWVRITDIEVTEVYMDRGYLEDDEEGGESNEDSEAAYDDIGACFFGSSLDNSGNTLYAPEPTRHITINLNF